MMEPPVKHARPAVGHEGMPVVGLDEAGGGEDEDKDGGDFDEHEDSNTMVQRRHQVRIARPASLPGDWESCRSLRGG